MSCWRNYLQAVLLYLLCPRLTAGPSQNVEPRVIPELDAAADEEADVDGEEGEQEGQVGVVVADVGQRKLVRLHGAQLAKNREPVLGLWRYQPPVDAAKSGDLVKICQIKPANIWI